MIPLPEVVHTELGSGVVAVAPAAAAAVVHRSVHAAVEAGAAAGPDPLTDEAVGDGQHGDREEEEGQAEVDGVVRVGEPAGEHSRAPLNVGNNSCKIINIQIELGYDEMSTILEEANNDIFP